MKRFFLSLTVTVSLLTAVFGLAVPAHSYASAFSSSNAKDQACSGISGSEQSGACTTPGRSVTDIIRTVINFLSAIIGAIAVIMMVVSGFKYVSSGGDAGKITSAKTTLIYAIVGLVIVALAQSIVQFVLTKATKTDTNQVDETNALVIDRRA